MPKRPRPKRERERHEAIGRRLHPYARSYTPGGVTGLVAALQRRKAPGVSSRVEFYRKLNGEEAISADLLHALCELLKPLNPGWVMTGIGPPLLGPGTNLETAVVQGWIDLSGRRHWERRFVGAMRVAPFDSERAEVLGHAAAEAALAVILGRDPRDHEKLEALIAFAARTAPPSAASAKRFAELVSAAARVLVRLDDAFAAEDPTIPWPASWNTKQPSLIYLGLCDQVLQALRGFLLTSDPRK